MPKKPAKKPAKDRPSTRKAKPRIDRIVEPVITPGVEEFIKPGRVLTSGRPGTLVLIVGNGFGKDSDAVTVRFGPRSEAAFPPPLFSDNYVLTTIPLVTPGVLDVGVTVAGASSNEVPFRVDRPIASPRPPGSVTLKFISTLDAFAVLVSAEMRIADFGRFATREFQNEIANEVLQARVGLLQARQRFENAETMGADLIAILGIADEQVKKLVMQTGEAVAERSKALFDQIVQGSQVIPQLELGMNRIRAGGTTTATKTLEIVAEGANLAAEIAAAAESATQSVAVSAELGVVVAGVDIEGNNAVAVAAAIYGIAKAIANGARIAALLSRNADEDRQEQEEMDFRRQTETKLDRAESKLDKVESKLERIETKADRAEQKLDKNEMKKDKIEVKLDRVEQKLDKNEIKKDRIEAKLDRVEPKLDRVETKLDRHEGKLDKLEGKADKGERKLDTLEAKADRAESKLDKLEGKADKAEGKLDKLEGKADKAEGKLDKLEGKADKAEGKLDRLEGKADKAEGKLDKLEGKADKAEGKLDKLEGKADKAEGKLDKLEGKIDKTEIKLDFLAVKADRTKEFWQFSPDKWTVAKAMRVGVKMQSPLPPLGPTDAAFNVESIEIPVAGSKVIKLIVDGIETDVSSQNLTTPCSVLVSLGLALIGASNSVSIEFEAPYTGPVEFNGEKPQALKLCTIVEGPGASQNSPAPC